MAQGEFRYWAFLSYSHADEAVARRLHRALEHYTIPRRLRRAHSLPRRLIPVFRDVEELEAASALTERLQDALDESRWLIVLCSTASAKSRYVNAEIEYFIQKHGARRVLCALIDGEPADSFPPAIKALKDEPLASDFRAGRDFELGRLKLIAAMAVVGFTELGNREAQRKKRTRMAIAASLGAIGIGALAYWDLFHREHVDYYVNYVRRDGVWEGVDQITAERASHRAMSFRFMRNGRLNPPERVDVVNGSGGCADGLRDILGDEHKDDFVPLPDPYCAATFSYTRDGAIRQETLLNKFGAAKQGLTYTADDVAQLTQQGFDAPSKGGGVRFVQFSRDDRGRDTEIRYLYSRGVPRPNQHHHYGYALQYDDAGRTTSSSVLDEQGKEIGEVTRYVYAADGTLTEERSEDSHGAARINAFGYAIKRYESDPYGNPLKESYHAADGALVHNSRGFATVTSTYDDRGNVFANCWLDELGKPALSDRGTPCIHYARDHQGRATQIAWTDAEGVPMMASGGFSRVDIAYDPSGRSLDMRMFDTQGKRTEDDEGIAGAHLDYDSRGNSTSRRFIGANDQPVLSTVGAQVQMKFDERDNRTDFLMLDAAGKPYAPPGAGGYAERKTLFDERGNLTEIDFLGADGQPVITKRGFAIVTFKLDEFGNDVESRMLDASQRLIRDKRGIAIYRARFDRLGRKIEETYFDEHEQPATQEEGYYGYRAEFDHLDRQTQTLYLDAHGEVMKVAALGFAGRRETFDALGRVVETSFLGTDAQPARDAPVTRIEYVLDAYGNEVARKHYDAAGALALFPTTGCAIQRKQYDQYNNLSVEICLDTREQITNNKKGWATKRMTREHGRVVKEDYFDAAGKPVTPKG